MIENNNIISNIESLRPVLITIGILVALYILKPQRLFYDDPKKPVRPFSTPSKITTGSGDEIKLPSPIGLITAGVIVSLFILGSCIISKNPELSIWREDKSPNTTLLVPDSQTQIPSDVFTMEQLESMRGENKGLGISSYPCKYLNTTADGKQVIFSGFCWKYNQSLVTP